ELMASLTGPAETNPLTRWQGALRDARALMDDLRYPDARSRLADLLIDVQGLQGSGADALLPVTHGMLGEAHFQSGEADRAVPHFERALALCERTGDGAGVLAYL